VPYVDLTSAPWRTSSYSGGNGGQCIQVAAAPASSPGGPGRLCAVRDSKDPAGPVLVFGTAQWRAFAAAIKTGTLRSA
jgi:hypothetical protein